MALRSGYKGIKKLAAGLKWNRPGILAADDTALAKVFFPRSEQAVLGAKNLLPNNWSWEDTGALDGITLTRNSDDTITVGAGTVSGGGGKWLFNTTLANLGIKKGRYKVTANIPSSLGGNVFFTIKDNTGNVTYNITGSTQEVEFEVTDVNINHTWHIYTWFNNNTVISESFVMQPMIRLASDTDNTFASHAMTNEQLTDKASVKTIAHATAITEGDLSVTFTEYITGNVEQIIGVISSSVDKDIASQSGISIGTALAHKPLSSVEVIGSIDSSLSASDRRPICSIRISNTGRISIDGQMSANRNYTFTITYIFGS